jgi:hypothetical protein
MNKTTHLENGKIFFDVRTATFSRSLTIKDGKVVGIDSPAPNDCTRINLQGKFALPAFVDSHVHLIEGACGIGDIDASQVNTKSGFAELFYSVVSNNQEGNWMVGYGWRQEQLGELPDSSWFPNIEIPMLCYSKDFHSAVLNETALKTLPLSEIQMMNGGKCIRQGLVQEDALYKGVCPLIPELDIQTKRERLMQTLKRMQSQGIVLLGSMEDLTDVKEILCTLDLPSLMRVRVMLLDPPSAEIVEGSSELKDEFLQVIGFKAFLDGSLGSRTARMYEPWLDAEGNGLWSALVNSGGLQDWAKDVVRAGYAPIMHAIGDAAVGEALNVIDNLEGSKGARIEHAQFIANKDVAALSNKMFGVQPLHQPYDDAIAFDAVGSKRRAQLYNWRRMLDAGARLSFGSDWPVAEAIPLSAIRVAINNGLTIDEALYASTVEAAQSLGVSNGGSLDIGFNGDVVVLDENPFECDWKVAQPSVTMTILAGNVVFKKEDE